MEKKIFKEATVKVMRFQPCNVIATSGNISGGDDSIKQGGDASSLDVIKGFINAE